MSSIVTVMEQFKYLKTCDLDVIRMNIKHTNIHTIHILVYIYTCELIHTSSLKNPLNILCSTPKDTLNSLNMNCRKHATIGIHVLL